MDLYKDKQGNNTTCSRFHYNIENEIENAKKDQHQKHIKVIIYLVIMIKYIKIMLILNQIIQIILKQV